MDNTCGNRVPVTDPAGYAADIAAEVRRMAGDSALLQRMGQAACAKVLDEGLWSAKAARMVGLYQSISAGSTGSATCPIGYRASPIALQEFHFCSSC